MGRVLRLSEEGPAAGDSAVAAEETQCQRFHEEELGLVDFGQEAAAGAGGPGQPRVAEDVGGEYKGLGCESEKSQGKEEGEGLE